MSARINIASKETLHSGWSRLTRVTLDYTRDDGTTQRLEREIFDHGHAACVLLFDPARETVVLIRQFRLPAYLDGDDGWITEVCAGLLDDDDPETCARREAIEETGHEVDGLTLAFTVMTSPGSVTEKVSCFIGTYHDRSRIAEGGGLHHEGEEIDVLEMPLDDALAMVRSGEIVDAKTVMLLQHLELERLRAR